MILRIYTNSSLEFNDKGQLKVAVSSASGNTLKIKSDGLYSEKTDGNDGTSGTGYDTKLTNNGFIIGYASDFNHSSKPNRISCSNVIHRTWISTTSNDSDVVLYSNDNPISVPVNYGTTNEYNAYLKFFRPAVDYILPGDFYIGSDGVRHIITESHQVDDVGSVIDSLGDL